MNQDFKEFLGLLNENRVEYLIVGGYAVAYYGHPRYTKDIDIWIKNSKENAHRLIQTLYQFGFEDVGIREDDFLDIEGIIQLGYPPNRIDIISGLKGVDFDISFARKTVGLIGDLKVFIISLEDLKSNKKATGRHQDLADLENLS